MNTYTRIAVALALALSMLAQPLISPHHAVAASCPSMGPTVNFTDQVETSWGAVVTFQPVFVSDNTCHIHVLSLTLQQLKGLVYVQGGGVGEIIANQRIVAHISGPATCQGLPHASTGHSSTFNVTSNAELRSFTIEIGVQEDCPDRGRGFEGVSIPIEVDH